MEIRGNAKNTKLEHGEWLNINTYPCERYCPRRSEGCHAKCEEYLKWDKMHRLAREERMRHEAATDISKLKPKQPKEWEKYRTPKKNVWKGE